jgi:hypothetical protein
VKPRTTNETETWCTVQSSFDQAFSRLLASWRHHQQLRARDGSFGERLDAASQLMNARVEMARARRFL